MELRITFAVFAVFFLVGTIFSSSFVLGQYGGFSSRSASSVRYQETPTFQSLYRGEVGTYWPVLGDRETCEAREDFMLQVAPLGCQPVVVRSDLLAEQDVPVFCQINAIDINPLVDIEQIRNIQFTGQYPPEVAGAGFHPARAALGSYDNLVGSPLANNIGYVVLVLKRQPDESQLPESVNVTLRASIDYDAGNAYGIGRSEFILEPTSFGEWDRERFKQSFWNGRYFVRLEEVDENYAVVSIYNGEAKVMTTRVERGETSEEFYVPGMYCRAGLRVAYDDYIAAEEKARIEVSSGNSVDAFDVYEGSRFLDGRCNVRSVQVAEDGETGKVVGYCGSEQFVLELKKRGEGEQGVSSIFISGKSFPVEKFGNKYWVDMSNYSDSVLKGKYYFESSTRELFEEGGENFILNASKEFGIDVQDLEHRDWYLNLYSLMEVFVGEDSGDGESVDFSQEYFDQAIAAYERVVDDYPDVGEGVQGKEALRKAIDLAKEVGDTTVAVGMINRYLDLYPGDEMVGALKEELESIRNLDVALASEVIEVDGSMKVLRLDALSSPERKASADFTVENSGSLRLILGGALKELNDGGKKVGEVKLDKIDIDRVEVGAYCMERDENNRDVLSNRKQSFLLRVDEDPREVCGVEMRLDSTDVERVAKVRLIPSAEGVRSETNLTVAVGIEKRVVELTPDKVMQKIENLNESIRKWQKIADSLGKIVSGMKGACFATAALLTFKNFMTGLSGEALARQEVMRGDNGWTQWCEARVPKEYPTMDACFLAKSSEIDADVSRTTVAINKVNQRIQQLQQGHTQTSGLFGKSVNTEALRIDLAREISDSYGGEKINMSGNPWVDKDGEPKDIVTVAELLTPENVENGLISTEGMRSLMLNAELQKQGGLSERHEMDVGASLADVAERVNSNMNVNWQFEQNKAENAQGIPSAFQAESLTSRQRHADVRSLNSDLRGKTGLSGNVSHIATVIVPPGSTGEGEQLSRFGAGTYYLGLEGNPQTGVYSIKEVTNSTKGLVNAVDFSKTYSLGTIRSLDGLSYQNEIQSSDRYVRYYETEPYKGMPAIVPFDTREGWYAATQQTLPVFGGIGAFDASGRVTSFWICNVGENGRIQFESGFGDDLCQQINLNTGQPLNAFPGLDSTKASSLIQRGQRAIQDAARQYGNKFVSVDGERVEVGTPSVGTPGTNCQDFMSPKDCHLLFNVCDPVICPPSRCNLGGTYHVANVIQTGIIGSVFMCLPNVREGIFIPVCLTGIHAGIEGLISIMKNYRDCLQENLETGEMVGICDQIYSIYLCEFFWNQVAPFVNVIIPKLIEFAYGQGVRGGAEYLSVMSAWQNMENSVNYFTQQYAVNSFEAFQARSVQEVGTEFCKAFISVKAPTAFDTLLEPDSPAQFHAWFDEKTHTTATVPATSRYKVFYHIFAGNDQGAHYNVYLRDPPTSGYYAANPTVQVASGYINRGDYASETRDFTAPQGYKELCVRINNQEECGFGQVSTSFAVDYLRDEYIESEASRTTITSQKECVSGGRNLGAVLTPNYRAGIEDALSPEIYNAGVVRICSSENPGSGTDPSRYTDVGYCDDPKIRCWIDKRSVEQAITQGNVGALNDTLAVLDERTRELLQAQEEIYSDTEAAQKLLALKERVKEGNLQSPEDALNVLNESRVLFKKLFWNRHKAELLIVQGDAYSYLTLSAKLVEDSQKPEEDIPEDGPDEDDEGGDGYEEEEFSVAKTRGDIPETLVNLFGKDEQGQDTGGNGFFVPLDDGSLGIVTAYHVIDSEIDDGEVEYTKVGESGTEFATIESYDMSEDVTLLETARPIDSVKVVQFGEPMEVNDNVYIIGQNPNKVSEGVQVLSEIVNDVNYDNPDGGQPVVVLSGDKGLDKGMSGAPVFNENYELVGIVTSRDKNDHKFVVVTPVSTLVELFDEVDFDLGEEEEREEEQTDEIFTIDLAAATPLYYKFDGQWLWSDNKNNWYDTSTTKTGDGRSPVQGNLYLINLLRGKSFEEGKEILEKAQRGEIGISNSCESACGFWGCDKPDCESAGACWFEVIPGLIKNKCHSCEYVACANYPTKEACEDNMCNVADESRDVIGCFWNDNANECGNKIEDSEDGDNGGPCKVDNLRWEYYPQGGRINLKVKDGQPVYLKVDRSGSCDKVDTGSVYFVISEKDLYYDDVVKHVNEVSLEGDTYVGVWEAVWEDENPLWAKDDPEYYFGIYRVSYLGWGDDKSGLLGVQEEDYVPPEDGSGDEGDEGGESEPEPFTLQEMFDLYEPVSGENVYVRFKAGGDADPVLSGLYIENTVIRKAEQGGDVIVGSLSNSISAMRGAGVVPVMTIINDMDVEINGEFAFRTLCLDKQEIFESGGELKVNFVAGTEACPSVE